MRRSFNRATISSSWNATSLRVPGRRPVIVFVPCEIEYRCQTSLLPSGAGVCEMRSTRKGRSITGSASNRFTDVASIGSPTSRAAATAARLVLRFVDLERATAHVLAVEALERRPVLASRRILLSILAGASVAAATAPLGWWLTHGWTGGAVLFVVFYCAVGIIQTIIEQGELRPRDALEYGLVPLAAFIVLAVTA